MEIVVGLLLLSACLAPLLHRWCGNWLGWVTALPPLAATAYFGSQIPAIVAGETLSLRYAWIPELGIHFSLHLDGLSLLMALLICGIGTLVVIYAGSYLAGRATLGVFFGYFLFFMASMLGLTLANNLILLLVFWEMTTISSYLLIGFEHERPSARSAALQALLVTAGGGLALMAGALLLGNAVLPGYTGGTFELTELAARGDDVRQHAHYLPILLLVLIGAFTKSAQVPFHFWLPGAMEAPTPVSAYLHSATMVKAGIYLLARFYPVLGDTAAWSAIVTPVGATTMLLGAWLAFQVSDLKQILAYSTISILGVLTMLIGVGTEATLAAAMAMLLAHALYKATLFLIAGAVDHEAGERSIERLGGLRRTMPLTAATAGLAALSMAGIVPTFGFIAKEVFYEAAQHAPYAMLITSATMLASAMMTAVAGLVAIRPFFGEATAAAAKAHEPPWPLWICPAILALLGIALGVAPGLLAQPLVAPAAAAIVEDGLPIKLTLWHGFNLTLALSLVTVAVGVVLYLVHRPLRRQLEVLQPIYQFGPGAAYQQALTALNAVARGQTSLLQSGYLRFYLLSIVAAMVGLIWLSLGRLIASTPPPDMFDVYVHEGLLAISIVVATCYVVMTDSRLGAVTGLGVVGYCVAAVFVMYGGPDLAMTQFIVETLTVILLVLVMIHLPRFRRRSQPRDRLRDALVALTAGGTLTALLLFAIGVRTTGAVSTYFVENSYEGGHGRNIVNVILVDFRAIDTLGEITVLGVAGVGVYALLKLRTSSRGRLHSTVVASNPTGQDDSGKAAEEALDPNANVREPS